MTKKLLPLFAVLSLFSHSCTQETESPTWKSHQSDSTFNEFYASIYIDSSAEVGDELRLLPINHYAGEVVRVRNECGWGTFDAIATIYRDLDCKVQMVYQNIKSNPRGFQIQEFILPNATCDTIFDLLDNGTFYSLPFDLEPSMDLIDGGMYSIAYKNKKNNHVVTWQRMSKEDKLFGTWENSSSKKVAEKIYFELFKYAKRPLPCVIALFNSNFSDSITYHSYLIEGYDYLDSIRYVCTQCFVKYSAYGMDTITQKIEVDTFGNIQHNMTYQLFTTQGDIINDNCIFYVDLQPESDIY